MMAMIARSYSDYSFLGLLTCRNRRLDLPNRQLDPIAGFPQSEFTIFFFSPAPKRLSRLAVAFHVMEEDQSFL